jgi:hypothetical protein
MCLYIYVSIRPVCPSAETTFLTIHQQDGTASNECCCVLHCHVIGVVIGVAERCQSFG